ncbi:MAG: efflux RND transporter periplasmic adaptor subunit [Halieaceae bacterium]|jgi:RND family efflux transporter MFP subunit|nr:efflux RND transporter periplasmic adaptor subunit [Halieaceae bacterium]
MTPNWTRNWLWTLLVLIVGGGAAYAVLVGKSQPEPRAAQLPAPPVVDVVLADLGERALWVETQGTVRPLREIKLVSQVAGRVESVSPQFAAGGFFAAGVPLLKVEDFDYKFAIARAQSQVAGARQRVAEEQGRALQAKREWRDLGSEQANTLFLREPQLASARAALHAAEADLGAANLNLDRTSIAVPFNGRISTKHVDIGQYVTPGTVVADVYDTDIVQVRLPLTDRQVALLDLPLNYENTPVDQTDGAAVILRARFADQIWEWHGRIVRTDASIDVDSRVVYAVAEVHKPFAREGGSERPPLAPGLFVNATISGKQMPAVAVLPRSALRSDATVMIVDDARQAQLRRVHVLQSSADQIWVQGLRDGDRIIARAAAVSVAGTEVTVKETTTLASGE